MIKTINQKEEAINTIKKLLDDSQSIYVLVNTKEKGIKIPEYLMQNSVVTLELSLLFRGNLFFVKEGIRVWLIFDVDYEECFIPWESIISAKPSDREDEQYVFSYQKEFYENFELKEGNEKSKEDDEKGEVKSKIKVYKTQKESSKETKKTIKTQPKATKEEKTKEFKPNLRVIK